MQIFELGDNAYEIPFLFLVVLIPLLGAIFSGIVIPFVRPLWRAIFDRELGKLPVSIVGPLAIYLPFIIVLKLFLFSLDLSADEGFRFIQPLYDWITVGSFKLGAALEIDPLSMIMALVVTGVSFLIHVYSIGYMADDASYSRYFAYLNLFVFAMLLLVLGNSLPLMFIGWEGVGLCSYLLIGFWFEDTEKAKAGLKAFITNRIGDFGFLLGIFFIYYYTQSLSFEGIEKSLDLIPKEGVTIICLLLFVGAAGKSAQIPLYVWLPDAMAGPTPVSALIHAATMVTAGVYMVARLNFLYALSPAAMTVVALVGAITAFFAATMGVLQNDIKKVLAYSTISQLGFMFAAVGVGAYWVGIFHLATHAFFKACLFLGAGSVIVGMHHEQDMRNMGGLRKLMPVTAATYLISTLAISGIPPFAGFFSKDEILWKTFTAGTLLVPGWLIWAILTLSALMTAFYMFRSYYMTFSGESRADEHTREHIKESPISMTGVLVALALFATVAGFFGFPHVFSTAGVHVPNWLEHYLRPTFEGSRARLSFVEFTPTIELVMMGVSILVALTGIFFARSLYKDNASELPAVFRERYPGLYQLVFHKYYIDEIYDALILTPVRVCSEWLWKIFDKGLIDSVLVDGSAVVTRGLGYMVHLWQNGNLQRYLITFGAGAAILVLIMFS